MLRCHTLGDLLWNPILKLVVLKESSYKQCVVKNPAEFLHEAFEVVFHFRHVRANLGSPGEKKSMREEEVHLARLSNEP